jgi:deoxyribodipyrimidine photo-lyase
MTDTPLILWFRRDLRLGDNQMLATAVASGRPVIPVFILDAGVDALGAAAKWRLGLSLARFQADLGAVGSKLTLRRGPPAEVLAELIAQTGASGAYWSRAYDPDGIARDTVVKSALQARGFEAESHVGHLLFEPWSVKTGQGGYYRVYTPFWNSVKNSDVPAPLAAPSKINGPAQWPQSDPLASWQLGRAMNRGADVVSAHVAVGEVAALDRLDRFLDGPVEAYKTNRDFAGLPATSRLSENLTYGEISPRLVWHRGQRAMLEGAAGAEHFLKELVWREFAYHLLFHTPHMLHSHWRDDWQGFAWRGDNDDAERWRRGMTGEPFVDAAMREMYVTGTMHNRARMIAASYLTKHLMTDWRVGLRWFQDCLTDWDPAANAMGWQWVAGCGPDASPFFRIFNSATQAEKFDAQAVYRRRFIAELSRDPGVEALSYFDAVPLSWGLSPQARYPVPMISLAEGRERALLAYSARNSAAVSA